MRLESTIIALALVTPLFAACGHTQKPPAEPPVVETSAKPHASTDSVKTTPSGTIGVSDDLATACSIDFGNVDRAPRFAFDDTKIEPQDARVLDQIAKCVTSGPMKGRAIRLVGRADPRGETEYDMALGEHRAGSVRVYLLGLGVSKAKVVETSRGKLDATGTDEVSWQRDRRVDIVLQ
jgi:peptidoglycan-associated lipoprotein